MRQLLGSGSISTTTSFASTRRCASAQRWLLALPGGLLSIHDVVALAAGSNKIAAYDANRKARWSATGKVSLWNRRAG